MKQAQNVVQKIAPASLSPCAPALKNQPIYLPAQRLRLI